MSEFCLASWGDFLGGRKVNELYRATTSLLSTLGFEATHVGIDLPGYSNSKLSLLNRVEKKIINLDIDISTIRERGHLEIVSSPAKSQPALDWLAYASFVWRKPGAAVLATEEEEEAFRKSHNFMLLQIRRAAMPKHTTRARRI